MWWGKGRGDMKKGFGWLDKKGGREDRGNNYHNI